MQLKEVLIRLAEDNDFASIYEIWKSGISPSFDTSHIDFVEIENKFKANFANRYGIFNYWVALRDERIIGWQSLIKTTTNPIKDGFFAESSTYVHDSARSLGLATLLVKHVIELAKDTQLRYITAYINSDNVAIRRTAVSTGWIELGELPNSSKSSIDKSKLFIIRPL